jgi:hypothetical protein
MPLNDKKIEKLQNLLKVANEDYATPEDLKIVIDTFAQRLKETASIVASTVKGLSNDVETNKKELLTSVNRLERTVSTILEDEQELTKEKFDRVRRDFETRLREVLRLIPEEADFSEINQELADLKNTIQELRALFTADNIRNALELLEGDERLKISAIAGLEELLEELRNRPVATGGGGASPFPVVHWPRHESFAMNGVATTVTLAEAVGAQGTAIFAIRYQGQVLDLGTQYTVNGNLITFTFTPLAGTTISVSYMP